MNSLVSQVGRSEQCIHNGVHYRVAVAVPQEPVGMRNVNAAQNQPPTLNQAVGVKSYSNAKVGKRCFSHADISIKRVCCNCI